MIFTLSFFPNSLIDPLKEAIPNIRGITKVDIYDNTDNSSIVKIECSDCTYLWFLGFWMGEERVVEAVREAMPKVERNVDNLIKKVTNQSEN